MPNPVDPFGMADLVFASHAARAWPDTAPTLIKRMPYRPHRLGCSDDTERPSSFDAGPPVHPIDQVQAEQELGGEVRADQRFERRREERERSLHVPRRDGLLQ